jgi:hypothetical protein
MTFVDIVKNCFRTIRNYQREEKFLAKGLCPLHECKLQKGEVSIVYGLIRVTEEQRIASARFPLACSKAFGGCFVYEGQPETRIVDYCERCRQAESEWLMSGNSSGSSS